MMTKTKYFPFLPLELNFGRGDTKTPYFCKLSYGFWGSKGFKIDALIDPPKTYMEIFHQECTEKNCI